MSNDKVRAGDLVTLDLDLVNITNDSLPMVTAVIGIPGGATLDHKLLKNLVDTEQCDYFEIFNNSLVLYWTEMDPSETIQPGLCNRIRSESSTGNKIKCLCDES